MQQTFTVGDFSNNIGLEFLGRRGVNGFDARTRLSNRTYSLREASEDAWSLFALSDWHPSTEFALEFGARTSTLDQDNRGADSSDAATAFTAGAIYTPDEASRFSFNLASGFRFATLEERFFSGVTPQGEIVGNPQLGAEHSVGADLGYAWQAGNFGTEVHLWRTQVKDLIQLFAVAPGVNGYTNVGDAELHGIEGWLAWTPAMQFSLRAGATLVRSKDELTGDPLYGSPPLTATLEARYDFSDFSFGAFYSHRWRMNRPGFEEVERDAVDVIDLDLTYHVNPSLNLQLFVRNAFNANYVATADVLSALAQERSIGFNVNWTSN